jgi:predicted DNA-binding protein (MmcQ/YjbR family)
VSFAKLAEHAMTLPGATQDIKWGNDWVASVGGKMFLVGGRDPKHWSACSFKVDEHRFLELTGIKGFAPAPYLARVKWVQLSDPKVLPLPELKALVERSHALVLGSLPKKVQKEILA